MTLDHFIVALDDHGQTPVGICGSTVPAEPVPPVDSPKCEQCEAEYTRMYVAVAYAERWKITPTEAGRALNLSPLVVEALGSVLG